MSSQGDWSRVEDVVSNYSRRGTLGITLAGPQDSRWQHQGERRFVAASTVKIPIMVEVYRQIDAGRLHLDNRYTLVDEDRTPGSGVLAHLRDGATVTLADLLYLMISISDNVATNVLLGMVGIPAVNETMQALGMARSNLGRLMRGRMASPDEVENFATPNDYVTVLEAILDQRAAAPESCAAMLDLLGTQQNRRRLARYLPASNQLRWGSKTGENIGVVNEAGFIQGPNGRLILAVYTENFPDAHVAEQTIGEIARAAMADSGVAVPLYTS